MEENFNVEAADPVENLRQQGENAVAAISDLNNDQPFPGPNDQGTVIAFSGDIPDPPDLNRISWDQFLRFVPPAKKQQPNKEDTSSLAHSQKSTKRKNGLGRKKTANISAKKMAAVKHKLAATKQDTIVTTPSSNDIWNTKYEELKRFVAIHGHSIVPPNLIDLCSWVTRQRSLNKKGKLEEDRFLKLKEVGFVWKLPKSLTATDGVTWNRRYEELKTFVAKHGHCSVPSSKNKSYSRLKNWCGTQKRSYRVNNLSEDRFLLLQQLGFFDNMEKKSGNNSVAATDSGDSTATTEVSGDGSVDMDSTADCGDGAATVTIKDSNNGPAKIDSTAEQATSPEKTKMIPPAAMETGGVLEPEKEDPIGAALNDEKWNQRYAELKAFVATHGHCSVPRRINGQPYPLGTWVAWQRYRYSQNQLPDDRFFKLNPLGFFDDDDIDKDLESNESGDDSHLLL